MNLTLEKHFMKLNNTNYTKSILLMHYETILFYSLYVNNYFNIHI